MGRKAKKPAARKRAPAPVAKPKSSSSTKADADLAALGDPPADPLAMLDYAARVNAIMLLKVMKDPELSSEKKSKEVRSISNTLKGLVPKARIYRAEQTVLNNKAELEQKMSERRGARLVPLPDEPAPEAPEVIATEAHDEEPPQH